MNVGNMICDFKKHMRSYIEGKGREDERREGKGG